MATRKKLVKDDEEIKNNKVAFDYSSMFHDTLDEISRRQGVDTDLMTMVEPMSTGLLQYDLLLGGGIRPAMYGHAGFEQSAKTTGALSIMAAAVKQSIGLIALFDYEGSTSNSIPYVGNILKTMDVKKSTTEIFGKRDPVTGKWIVRPIVRYTAESVGEKFFDWTSAVLREMPDKKYVNKGWWYIFDENNKKHKATVGSYADPVMRKKYGKGLWVPAQDGKLQGIIFNDSWPTMNPDSNDDETADNSLGVHARFFAKHLPRIKPKLARKMVALVGINQLREIPMAMYGPKEKEACGNALKFYSDVRTWWTSRSSGMPFTPKFDTEERLELEPSATIEGNDRYRYVQVVTKKNKLSQPGRKIWIRLWVENAAGEACGIDPVFDTISYLKDTGQLQHRSREKIFLELEELGKAKRNIDWMTLKKWILGNKEQKIKICNALGYKPMDLRNFCFRQIRTGVGETLYIKTKNIKSSV